MFYLNRLLSEIFKCHVNDRKKAILKDLNCKWKHNRKIAIRVSTEVFSFISVGGIFSELVLLL
jgi:hypothetical protein